LLKSNITSDPWMHTKKLLLNVKPNSISKGTGACFQGGTSGGTLSDSGWTWGTGRLTATTTGPSPMLRDLRDGGRGSLGAYNDMREMRRVY
jgi:hypothetical protein